jgi:hypothetical protein
VSFSSSSDNCGARFGCLLVPLADAITMAGFLLMSEEASLAA